MTANNHYFERNMLTNSQKNNEILESENWAPLTQLRNINSFLDSSAANISNQIAINNTLVSLLGNSTQLGKDMVLLNEKLHYQNSRPPGVGSDEVWLPTQLLMEMVRLLENQNKLQEETGSSAEYDVLKDISSNTGAAIPLLQDLSKNTVILSDLLIDNSKNLINLLQDASNNNIDNSKNLIDIKNKIETFKTDNFTNLNNINISIGTTNTSLGTINTSIGTSNSWLSNLSGNLYNSVRFEPFLQTLLIAQQVKKTKRSGAVDGTGNWCAADTTVAEGVWEAPADTYPPKKFTLFVKLDGAMGTDDYINLYGDVTAGGDYYLYKRYTHDDFNPPIVEADMASAVDVRTWKKVSTPFGTKWHLAATCDWIGKFMKIEIFRDGGGSPPKMTSVEAQGI